MIRGALAIFKRDFKKFIGNPFVLVFTLMMPIMYLVIFGNAMGGTITHIPIGVVQETPPYDDTPLFTNSVAALMHFSQDNTKPRLFDVTVYTSEDKAKTELRNARISGLVVFPAEVSSDHAIRLYVDSSDYMTPTLVQSGVVGSLMAMRATNTVLVNKIYGDITYIQFFGVGVIVMAIFMTTMMGGGIALIKDREMGIHEGYLVTPVKRTSIIVGMIMSGTVRAFLSGFIIFMVGVVITGVIVQSVEDFLLAVLVILIASVGVTSLMVSIASRFNNQQEYASTTAFFNLILFMTSGAFYPTIGMPDWLRWITVINPEWYAVHALRSIILRGQGLSVIMPDLVALILFSLLAITLGIMTYRRTLE